MKPLETPGAPQHHTICSAAANQCRNTAGTAANANRRSFLASLPTAMPPSPEWPWSLISHEDLARILGVNRAVLDRWRYRDILPLALPMEWLRGTRRFYRWSALDAWLSRGQRTEADHFRTFGVLMYGEDADLAAVTAIISALTDWAYFRDRGIWFTPQGHDAYMAECMMLLSEA
jgi:hypothetical protein